jgi:6-phosphogluconolactonase (cycloisomerase 2 family)
MSLALGLGAVACSRDYTAAYVYSVNNTNGQVNAYGVDYQTGEIQQIAGSPFVTNLTNPTTVVAAPNGKTLYIIGGTQNANIAVMSIGSDGKLYGTATPNITGTYPVAAAIDTTGAFLYVLYTYQTGFGPVTNPALTRGGISIFPINSDGSLGTASNVNVGNNPVAIAVSAPTCTTTPVISSNAACTSGGTPNVFVYVVDQETSPAQPTILGFAQNTSTGALTTLSGTTCVPTPGDCTGTLVGVAPSAIAIDPTSKYLYVTDKLQNEIFGYQIASQNSGNLVPLTSNPFTTGSYPLSITIEPRGKYVYVANYNSGTVSSYTLNLGNGSLGGSAGSGGFSTATGPTCVTVEPALGVYLFTSNYLDGSISAGQLSANTGQLSGVANSPFPTGTQPVCLTSVANGPHSSQLVTQ